jgi:heme exporter protein B
VSPLLSLLRKDLTTEWRQKHVLFGVLLYVGSTVFAVYAMAGRPEAGIWNALFWITQLFVAVNAGARSFLGESQARFRYYATLVTPATFFAAKVLYQALVQIVVTALSIGLFALLLGLPLAQPARFFLAAAEGGFSLALVFTFLSAIAAKAGGNAALMAILGFPLVTPLLMILSRLAAAALTPAETPGWWGIAGSLLGLDALVVILGLILFPTLWNE